MLVSSSEPEIKGLSLRANFSWTFIANIIYTGSQWGMLVVLARVGNPEMVGQFALGLAIAAPIIILAELNLRAVQATDAQGLYRFGDYLGLRLIMLMFAITGITAFALGSYRYETAIVIIAVGVAKGFESTSDVFYGLCQRLERMDRIARSLILKAVLSLAFLTLGVLLSNRVFWGTVGLALAWALVLLTYDVRSGRMLLASLEGTSSGALSPGDWGLVKPHWNPKTLLRLAWLALPLGLVLMLISLSASVPRYFIERNWGAYELGIFVAIAYLERAGATIANALGQSASPRMAKYYASGHRSAYANLLAKLIGVGILIGASGILVAAVVGKEILALLYGPEYARYTLFITIMIAVGINYIASFLGYAMTAARYFRVQFPLFTITTALMFVTCALMIPSGGLQAAANCLVIVAVVRVIGGACIVFYAIRRGSKPGNDTDAYSHS